jgi:uncharacterized protein (DUF1499 family)
MTNGERRPPGPASPPAGRILAPCRRPNCASTGDAAGDLPPLPYESRSRAGERLRAILAALPRTQVICAEEGYLRAESRTRLGFVDDVEVLLDEGEKRVHLRSAARVGYWDFGVNRRRLEEICRRFLAGGPV